MSRSMIASIITVTQVSIELREKKKVDKNIDIRVKHNTNNPYENGDE